MKKIIYFCLLMLFFSSCNQDGKSTNEEIQSNMDKFIALNIQYAKTYEYEYKFGEIDSMSAFLTGLIEFDKKGNPIKAERYNKSEYLQEYDETTYYIFDSENKCIETVIKDNLGETKEIIRDRYENGQNVERLFYNKDGVLTGKVMYKYDKNGNRTELISYDEDGKINYKTKSIYDSNNKIKEQKEYDNKGKLKSSFKVSEKGNGESETNYFDENNALQYKSIYTFYENKFVKTHEWIDIEDDSSNKTEYKYNEDGLVIEKVNYENHGEPKTIEKIEYIKFE